MKSILLVRHAKSSWKNFSIKDFTDRSITAEKKPLLKWRKDWLQKKFLLMHLYQVLLSVLPKQLKFL